jgi:hypothetical protein
MSDGNFDLNLFLRESKGVLVNPKSTFSSMKTSGGLAEPLIRSVFYGASAGAIALVWSMLNVGSTAGGLFGGSYGIMILVSYIIGAVIGLFAGGLILLMISFFCNGSTDYEASLRVIAAVMVIMPVASFFGFTGMLNPYLGMPIILCIHLFSIWLLYNGLVEALKAKPESVRIVVYILAALVVLFMVVSLGIRKRSGDILNDGSNGNQKELVMIGGKNEEKVV